MKATMRFDAVPKSDNMYKGRHNTWEYREDKKDWTFAVAAVARQMPKFAGAVTITLEYHFDTPNRRDPDNYSGKFILDGLVQAGVIKDDSFKYVDLRLRGFTDAPRGQAWTQITIEDQEVV